MSDLDKEKIVFEATQLGAARFLKFLEVRS